METRLEYILTHSYKEEMIAYIKNNPGETDELIKLSLGDKHPYSWACGLVTLELYGNK